MEERQQLASLCKGVLVLIGCGKRKRPGRHAAGELYTGSYFSLCLKLARRLVDDECIRILSAKYGCLRLDERIESYDLFITQLSRQERRRWSDNVTAAIGNAFPVYICGRNYYESLPEGLELLHGGMGEQQQHITNLLKPKGFF